MKSRLFYGLFIVYAAMVAFVLSINGVFTGEIESVSNVVINGVFLGIIGILFVMSAASFMRLNRLTDELEDAAGDLKEAYKKAGNQPCKSWAVKVNISSSSSFVRLPFCRFTSRPGVMVACTLPIFASFCSAWSIIFCAFSSSM